jgi:hypothetical protein
LEVKAFKPFERVIIWDSSGWQLRSKLKSEFKGNGGNASEAGCKIQFGVDLKTASIVHCELNQQSENDQGYSQRLAQNVNKNDLLIFDQGYFSIKSFTKIVSKGAFFLTRLSPEVSISVNGQPLNLVSYLKANKDKELLELQASIGRDKLETRIIICKVPDEVRKSRIRRLKKRTRPGSKKRKPYKLPSARKIFFSGWSFFITNAPIRKLPTLKVPSFYRLRWQIELSFKQLKTHLNIDVSNHANAFRLQCEVYSTLIVAGLLNFTHSLIQKELWKKRVEASLEKTYKFFSNSASILFNFAASQLKHPTVQLDKIMKMALKYCQKLKQNSRISSLQAVMRKLA